MSNAFTTLWTAVRCNRLKRDGQSGTVPELLLGGPHHSQPSFRRAGVQPGDDIYPIRVKSGVLYVVARMRVKEILTAEEYISRNPEQFAEISQKEYPLLALQDYFQSHPALRYLYQSCTEEVVTGEEGTPIRLDRSVPAEIVEQIRFCSQRRERGIRHIADGMIMKVISLHGIYRLSAESAEMFAKFIDE